MRHEDTESSAGTAISFLLIGLGIGAVVGLLCAPKTGRQMRKDLRRKLDDARGTFDDWRDEARDLAEEAV
jgi:gas vesicle protein